MKRICLVGACGSGKTVLAREIARRSGLPLFHLDQIYWQSGWKGLDMEEYARRHAELIAQERWILDGNFSSTYTPRFRKADEILFFDLPGRKGFWQAMWRTTRYWRRVRPDMPQGCPDRFNLDFIRYSWNFNEEIRPKILHAVEEAEATERMRRITSREEAAQWLEHRLPLPDQNREMRDVV